MILAGVAYEAARRRPRPNEIALLLDLTRVGVVFVALGGLMVLGFGIWLVELDDLGFGPGWIRAALILFGLSAVLGAAGGRRPKQARLLARRLADDGPTDELRRLLDDPLSRGANYVSAALVVAILVLMIWKPG